MNEMDLLTKIEGLEKAIKEHVDFADTYKTTLADTKQQLVDMIVTKVCNLFKEDEELDTSERGNHEPV